jgi:hypothetical protein
MSWSSYENSYEQTEEYAITLARLIHRHAPLLEELSVGRDDLASAVEQAYAGLKMASEQGDDDIEVLMSD